MIVSDVDTGFNDFLFVNVGVVVGSCRFNCFFKEKMMKKVTVLLVALVFVSGFAQGAFVETDWTFGNGSGQVSFVNSLDWPWSSPSTEVLYDGYADVTNGTGGNQYGAVPNGTFNLIDAPEWRVDWTMAVDGDSQMILYLGDRRIPNLDCLGLILINRDKAGTSLSNTIWDYNSDAVLYSAADGYDASAINKYSTVWNGSELNLFVNDVFVADIAGDAGVDAGYEGFQAGLYAGANVKFYDLAAAPVPEPATMLLLGAGGLFSFIRRKNNG